MAFTEDQTKALSAKLHVKHVRARREGTASLHYVEGWHVISEANRIFGYDGWDRETLEVRCLWQGARRGHPHCVYGAKVRITVHAGRRRIVREGNGTGHGEGMDPGDAHEKALKAAETDATKRALVTFGNPFGLALYDPEREGLGGRLATRRRRRPLVWRLAQPSGTECFEDPAVFSGALRRAVAATTTTEALDALVASNRATLERLRLVAPTLTDGNGHHFADLLEGLIAEQRRQLRAPPPSTDRSDAKAGPDDDLPPGGGIDHPKRLRDKDHLAFVGGQPCLVCDRVPVQVHHLTFVQPKAMGRKSGDQWTVPLCALHHREVHDAGEERAWWRRHRIDAEATAARLWQEHLDPGVRDPSAA